MKMTLAALALILGLIAPASATSISPRFGVLLMSTGTTNWGTLLNNSVFSVFDSSAASQGAPNTFSSSNTFLSPLLLTGTNEVLTGPSGYITSASSITASSFFGDGSHLTGISATPGNTVVSSFTVTGAGGLLVGSSVTASAYFGDGSHLTGLTATGTQNTFVSSVTVTNSSFTFSGARGYITTSSSVTASAFFGDASHLTGVPASPPNGAAGGNLAGTYPNPILGSQVIVATHIANGVITNTQLASGAFGNITGLGSLTSALTLTNVSETLTGSGGFITGVSSITASAFFGNGSHLIGIPSTGSIVGVYLPLAGGTLTGGLGLTNVAETLTGAAGVVTGVSSVTASAFFGDGSHISNTVTSIVAGTNVTISGATGAVTINSSGSGGFTGGPVANLSTFQAGVIASTEVVTGTMTVQGSAFSVGGSSFTVSGGTAAVKYALSANSVVIGATSPVFAGEPFSIQGPGSVSMEIVATGNKSAMFFPSSALSNSASFGQEGLSGDNQAGDKNASMLYKTGVDHVFAVSGSIMEDITGMGVGISSANPVSLFVVGASTGVLFDTQGRQYYYGSKPTVSSCGTGSPTVVGTDAVGIITTGTAATACTLTFNTPWTTGSTVVCNVNSNSATIAPGISAESTTAFTTTMSALTAGTIGYNCRAFR